MWQLAQTDQFDHILIETVRATFPENEHDHYIAHFRGLLKHWVESQANGQ